MLNTSCLRCGLLSMPTIASLSWSLLWSVCAFLVFKWKQLRFTVWGGWMELSRVALTYSQILEIRSRKCPMIHNFLCFQSCQLGWIRPCITRRSAFLEDTSLQLLSLRFNCLFKCQYHSISKKPVPRYQNQYTVQHESRLYVALQAMPQFVHFSKWWRFQPGLLTMFSTQIWEIVECKMKSGFVVNIWNMNAWKGCASRPFAANRGASQPVCSRRKQTAELHQRLVGGREELHSSRNFWQHVICIS